MSGVAAVLEADLTWTGDGFAPGVQVVVGPDGRIAEVGRLHRTPAIRLADRALLPGFVNAHSHAFQRGLRGHGESFPAGEGSFWSWREAMYGLVERLSADDFHDLTLAAFREMRRAGITTVGEFHYFHHGRGGRADWALDRAVLRAAATAGIRLVLLQSYYRTGGVGRELGPAQRRFDGVSPEAFWHQVDVLTGRLDGRTQTLGVAPHSLRAVPLDELVALHAEARRRGMPVHLHAEEQRAEIAEVEAALGARPLQLVVERLPMDGGLAAVHCTHSPGEQLEPFVASGATIVVCPTTEGNLGDGIPRLAELPVGLRNLALGTDSNLRISMLEEMRWLEYGQRLRSERRGLLADGAGRLARVLLHAATRGGARALGVDTGRIAVGAWADFAAIDLGAPSLSGATPATLLDALVFGAGEEAIAATAVGGVWDPPLARPRPATPRRRRAAGPVRPEGA